MLTLRKVNYKTREAIIIKWYEEVFPNAAAYIHRRGGNVEIAKEIFQESIVLYYEKLIQSNFKPEVDNNAYLMGIVKMRWLKYYKESKHTEPLSNVDLVEENAVKPLSQKLINYLKQTGEKCMDLLQAFYYEKLSMQEIAQKFNYSSERSATVQKYKCLEKVRDEVKQKSLNYEDFID